MRSAIEQIRDLSPAEAPGLHAITISNLAVMDCSMEPPMASGEREVVQENIQSNLSARSWMIIEACGAMVIADPRPTSTNLV